MLRILILLALAASATYGAIIDSGSVVSTRPYYVPDGAFVQVNLSSSDGGFRLSSNNLLGGGNMVCVGAGGPCPYGEYSISAFFPDASSFLVTADLEIGGVTQLDAVLGCPSPGCPHTDVRLVADPVMISGPGDYAVAFYSQGRIQAAATFNSNLLLDVPLAGYGQLAFRAQAYGNGFMIQPSAVGFPLGLRWSFTETPEPSYSLALLAIVVAAFRVAGRPRTNTAHHSD